MSSMIGRRVLCAAVLLLGARAADARPASTGFYAEGGLGAVAFLPPDTGKAAIGPTLDLRIGRDLASWLSFGIFLSASNHEATVPPPPDHQWFQLYRGGADVRLGGSSENFAFFVEGGAGVAMMSTNVLEKVMTLDPGERYAIMFQAGGGLEYQLENRHYAFGLAGAAFYAPQFDNLKGLDIRLYLRYTYGGG